MLVTGADGLQREVSPLFAGCRDELHAREKAREYYRGNLIIIMWTKIRLEKD